MYRNKLSINSATLYITVLFATLLTSCQSEQIKIAGRIVGGDSSVVYLEEINGAQGNIVDSVALSDKGEFLFNITAKDQHHKLYNIVYDWSTIPLFAAAGDKISLNSMGSIAKNYTIEGSHESELVRRFYQSYIKGIANLDAIAIEYSDESQDDASRAELAKQYTAEYNRIKREQLAFIIENKANLAAVYAIYQRLPNDSYLFTGKNDVIYYRTVAEALEENYPDSPYRKTLQEIIEEFDIINRLNNNITEMGYPDLELSDIYGNKQRLSSLDGKVILLDFWSAQVGSSNRNNAELKELYAKYKESGFEVYQVAIDSSKSTWINTIHQQELPWISVSDLNGNRSNTLTLYNVTALPSNFIISRAGEIIARDTYGDKLEQTIKQELAK